MFSSNTADLPRSKSEKERQEIIRMGSHLSSEYNNPCLKEQQLSYNCLSDMNYDRNKCGDFFQNYRNCRDFWVRADRRRKGIKPEMPWPEDREELKKEYMAGNRKS